MGRNGTRCEGVGGKGEKGRKSSLRKYCQSEERGRSAMGKRSSFLYVKNILFSSLL